MYCRITFLQWVKDALVLNDEQTIRSSDKTKAEVGGLGRRGGM